MDQKGTLSEAPPSYEDGPGSPNGDQTLPDYSDATNERTSSFCKVTDFSGIPSRPFPSSIHAHGEISRGKTFLLADATTGEDFFCIEIHTGIGGSRPLENRQGVILHDGLSKRDPIIAAAGDVNPIRAPVPQLSRRSIIFTPPLEPGKNHPSFDNEVMNGESSPQHDVVYTFSLESGEKLYRRKYEWRKFKDNAQGGFRLVRLYPTSEGSSSSASSSSRPTSTSFENMSYDDGDIIAVLKWRRFLSGFTLNGYFDLELISGGKAVKIEPRLASVIAITAARLWSLRIKGRTTSAYNKVADSTH